MAVTWKQRILNIYGQEYWHTEAKIVGSKEALEALKEAIDRAIKNSKSVLGGGITIDKALFASDGEGYELELYCLPCDPLTSDWNDWAPEYTGIKGGV